MQPHCPQCRTPIDAEHVNIQEMAAICVACNTVFALREGLRNRKTRKVLQPPGIRVDDGETLRFSFRTNFHLEKNESFINSAAMSLVFSLVTLLMAGLSLEGEDIPVVLPVIFACLAAGALYATATIVWNRTEISAAGDSLVIGRKPLPAMGAKRLVNLSAVDAFYAEETAASREQGYDTPRFHVWASEAGGGRKLVVGDLVEDYARYIASRLLAWQNENDAAGSADSIDRLADARPASAAPAMDARAQAARKEDAS